MTRLRQRYQPTPAGLLTMILAEFGDFAMMRKMLLGIKQRAEAAQRTTGRRPDPRPGTALSNS